MCKNCCAQLLVHFFQFVPHMTHYTLFVRKPVQHLGEARFVSRHLTFRNFYRTYSHRGRVCCAHIHGHSDCNGLRCPSLPAGIIPLALGILKEESETLGLPGGIATMPAGQIEVCDTVCALRSSVLECTAWKSCSTLDRLRHPKLPRAREMA
jgi:hypothetical protein